MMTQASGTTGAAAAGAAVLAGTPSGASPAPFLQALQALATSPDPADTLLAAGSAGTAAEAAAGATPVAALVRALTTTPSAPVAAAPATAAPPADAGALPQDLLLALFAATAAAAEAGSGQHKPGLAGSDDARAAAAARDLHAGATDPDQSATAQAALADPGAALLAAVLQWLQQQHPTARVAGRADNSSANGRESVVDTANTVAVGAAVSVPSADGTAANAAAGRDAGAGGALIAAAPGATPSSQLASQRDGDGRASGDHQPGTPAMVSDNAPGTGIGAAIDMAAALRAASDASPTQIERSVAVPVHERHWPAALAAQVLVLSNDKVQAATLRLSPEHLGPVEVRIDMQETNVNVSFTAAHAETRAALEQAMPQLRAVLAGAGLSLGQATVQQQPRRESQNSNALARGGGAAEEALAAPATVTRALGMIDEYV